MKNKEHSLEGKWVSTMPHDTDDYLVEYIITSNENGFDVSARDLQDDEQMEITNIKWDGDTLSFKSYMPSTERSGFAQFRLKSDGNIESKFTFTVLEELKRIEQLKAKDSLPTNLISCNVAQIRARHAGTGIHAELAKRRSAVSGFLAEKKKGTF